MISLRTTWLAAYTSWNTAGAGGIEVLRLEKTGDDEPGLENDLTVIHTAVAGIRMLCIYGQREELEPALEISRLVEVWTMVTENHTAYGTYIEVSPVPTLPQHANWA